MSSLPPSFLLSTTSSSSPKRKRGPPAISTIPPTPPRSSPVPPEDNDMRHSTNISGIIVIKHEKKEDAEGDKEAGASSPRTKIAYTFQGLQLEDAGPVARLQLHGPALKKKSTVGFGGDGAFDDEGHLETRMDGFVDGEEDEQVSRKKVKVVRQNERFEIPETPQRIGLGVGVGRRMDEDVEYGIFIGDERTVDPVIGRAARGVMLSNSVDEIVFTGTGSQSRSASSGDGRLGGSYPSINRLAQSKPRKKRMGTPPLMGMPEAEARQGDGEIDSQTASLTWHDDEITGHDPTDPDDDGEGINGIGFKPTPAEAYARTQKRRLQLDAYRNREARDARKLRSERRRGNERSKSSREEQDAARRVRFTEAEAQTVVSTS